MAVLCFVLDLRSLSPSLLADLKQLLLQLANLYAVSPSLSQSNALCDRIGLCYVFNNRISSSVELKVAYRPSGNLSLRDFHHAVNNLPTDAFSPEFKESGALRCCDAKLSIVFSDQVLYSWGDKDIVRKVIVLSSCLPENVDSALKNTLLDAADKCVSIEFVLFEQKSSHLCNMQEHINSFIGCISDLDNCSFQTYLPDVKVLHGLVKRWLQDLKDDMEEPIQARFIFKSNLFGSLNQITCSLSASVNQIIDGFSPCQTCRCHGIPLSSTVKNKIKEPLCPITSHDLEKFDVIENSVKVGENTVLFMPSFQSSVKLQRMSSPIDFKIIERTPLGSLNEGVIIGASYVVTPSACHEIETTSDEIYQTELNSQFGQYFEVFAVLYIHLTRRLAGSEEVLPVPDVNRFIDSSVPKEIEISIQTFLLKIQSRDYNPVVHERGFHPKLNSLVKESLQFGSLPTELSDKKFEVNSTRPDSAEVPPKSNLAIDIVVLEEENAMFDLTAGEDKTAASIAEEWEQLVVSEIPNRFSPSCVSKPKLDHSVPSPPDNNRQLDEKTSRILERLEVPTQLKSKVVSPVSTSSSISDVCMSKKKPLIPFQSSQASDQVTTSSQLMKPNFQRLKRKYK
ncbi:hypothetical protein KPL71_012357 [Citrus sinensis]|uniref:Uncharacterized protein n=1 Tax=Citrus sinensis TaxID=2711 RepID=A0ACB8LA76_CITSI|nr:hypothetical protein KPL71_012357 [Citrus sinensis]